MSGFANLYNRIKMMVARGVVTRANTETLMQALQVRLLAGETKDNVEFFETYGFTATPLAGAECIVLFLGGNRSHAIALATPDRRFRPKDLQPGEVSIWAFENGEEGGHRVDFKLGQKIEVHAKEVLVFAKDKADIETRDAKVTAETLRVICPDIEFN